MLLSVNSITDGPTAKVVRGQYQSDKTRVPVYGEEKQALQHFYRHREGLRQAVTGNHTTQAVEGWDPRKTRENNKEIK